MISSKNLGQGTLTTSPKVALGQQVRPSQSLVHPEKKVPLNKETHITNLVFHNEIVCGFPTNSHARRDTTGHAALRMKGCIVFLFSLNALSLIYALDLPPPYLMRECT